MGRRHQVTPYRVLNAVDISANQTQDGFTTIDGLDKVGILVEWTGVSPVGEFIVEAAYFYERENKISAWAPLDFGQAIAISGNSGSHTINIQDPPFQKIRVRYVATSGSGLMTATIYGAGKGA